MAKAFNDLRIVLVEPAGALNVGAIARVMKNLGFSQLVLVNPRCDPLGDEARMMAVHAADVLEQARQVSTLPEALKGCQQAVATTARDRAGQPLYPPEVGLGRLLPRASAPLAAALIFGPEDRGLSNEELTYAQCGVKIPTNPAYASLNLAQAVAICCYELSRLVTGEPSEPVLPPHLPEVAAPLDQLEQLYGDLEETLLKIGYLYSHTASSRMEKFRAIGYRAQLSSQDIAMLRGILRQMRWFAGSQRSASPPAEE
ncbi:MAG: RNA methyltransferase [Cyanobacteria bacterium P01_A01_bin.135]